MAEKALLRKYFYKQRLEVWELLPTEAGPEEFLSIDFNHLYLKQLMQKLPINQTRSGGGGLEVGCEGFYYAEHYIKEGMETNLPTWEDNTTFYKTGWGRGIYWGEELQYFKKCGGHIQKVRPVIMYKGSKTALKALMEEVYKIPDRSVRKQLANQFCGRLGRKT